MKRLLYQDDHLIAVFKSHDLFVHPSGLGPGQRTLMQRWRDILKTKLFPVHRLDRATAGIVLFATNSETAGRLASMFRERMVGKRYFAIVRGYTEASGSVDKPLAKTKEKERREALTHYRRLRTVELPYPVGRYPTARYSLVEATPETGRQHQIRRHFLHISHPIVGDSVYGDGEHNRFMGEYLDARRLWLFAKSLVINHPHTGEKLCLEARLDSDWRRSCRKLFNLEDENELEMTDGGNHEAP